DASRLRSEIYTYFPRGSFSILFIQWLKPRLLVSLMGPGGPGGPPGWGPPPGGPIPGPPPGLGFFGGFCNAISACIHIVYTCLRVCTEQLLPELLVLLLVVSRLLWWTNGPAWTNGTPSSMIIMISCCL
ncbi:hypothetical protein HYC85_010274, partial [Camellia sinensis]